MCSYGVGVVSTGVDERVGRRVHRTSLALGCAAGSGASGDGRTMGAETRVNNELVEVGGFLEN